jgi:hypothetical protein
MTTNLSSGEYFGWCGTGYLDWLRWYIWWILTHHGNPPPHPPGPDPDPWDRVVIFEQVVQIEKVTNLQSLLSKGFVISTQSALGKTVGTGQAVLQKSVKVSEIVKAGAESLGAMAAKQMG